MRFDARLKRVFRQSSSGRKSPVPRVHRAIEFVSSARLRTTDPGGRCAVTASAERLRTTPSDHLGGPGELLTACRDGEWSRAAFWPRGARWHGLVWAASIFCAYVGAVVLYPWSSGVALLWLPNAVLVTALLRFRPRDWPFVYAVGIAAEIAGDLTFDMPTYQAFGLGVVNSAEATLFVLFASFIAGGRNAVGLLTVRGTAAVVLTSVTVPVLTGALGGAIVESTATFGAEYFTAWQTWWFGDSLGLLVGVPIGLLLRDAKLSVARHRNGPLTLGCGTVAALLLVVSGTLALAGNTYGAQQTALAAAVVLSLTFGAVGAPIAAMLATTVTLIGFAQHSEDIGSIVDDQTLLVVVLAAVYAIAAVTESADRAMDQLSRARNDLALLSRTDELTGMSNRRALSENLELLWGYCARESKPVAMLMVDIDCFHQYNTTYGHVSGDSVIRRIARIIQGCGRRKTDLVVRYGGEEFLLVMPNTKLDEAERIADRIHQGIRALHIEHAGSPVAPVVTVSIGLLAVTHVTPGSATTNLERCDAAMYQAKASGRNRTVAVRQ
ncbi:diguanylate cyclase [Mycolicibacterium sp.]